MGTHKIDPNRRYVGEDAALTKICEQLAALGGPDPHRPGPGGYQVGRRVRDRALSAAARGVRGEGRTMSDAAPAEVLERIKKLLNLASKNSSEGEAASAAAKAQELLAAWNLDVAKQPV